MSLRLLGAYPVSKNRRAEEPYVSHAMKGLPIILCVGTEQVHLKPHDAIRLAKELLLSAEVELSPKFQ